MFGGSFAISILSSNATFNSPCFPCPPQPSCPLLPHLHFPPCLSLEDQLHSLCLQFCNRPGATREGWEHQLLLRV